VNLTLDATSTWVVTGTAYLSALTDGDPTYANITCANSVSCQVYVAGTLININN
jgi:hypothetical protein